MPKEIKRYGTITHGKMVKTKKRFVELINKMEKPILYHGDYGSWDDYISQSFFVRDDEDRNKKFNLSGCKNTGKEPLESYEKREKKLIIKYEKWFYDAWGNYGYIVRNNQRET